MKEKSNLANVIFTFISLLIFILLLYLLMETNPIIAESFNLQILLNELNKILPKIIVIILLYFIFRLFYLVIMNLIVRRFRGVFLSNARFDSLEKLIKFIWWTIFIIIVVSFLVNNIGSLIASAGLIGLGLTFALQKPILNFVGWITIIVKNIYNEGDRIKVGNIVGDVKEIQLMNTLIYSLLEDSNVRSHKIVTIPNELVLTEMVENYTAESNYIRDELRISITYESNFKKAMELLENIVSDLIKRNIKSYIKVKQNEHERINQLIKNLIRKGKYLTEQRANLDKEQSELKKEIEDVKTLEEEFLPKIRLEMADSSLILIAQFLTPFYDIKKNRTEINKYFLEAVKLEKDIEVAYPHMELVYHGVKKNK